MSTSPLLASRFSRLPDLPRPVYFVTRDPRWKRLIDEGFDPRTLSPETIEGLYSQCVATGDIWTAQVVLDLRQCGLNVHLTDRPVPGQVCFVPYWYLPPRSGLYHSYIVALHHDSPRPALCEQRAVINEGQANGIDAHFIPHRPQPNLKPRDPGRGTTIRTLAFKGEHYNLFETFRSEAFLGELRRLGVELVVNTEHGDNVFESWADYRNVDLVLAVRNNTVFDINLKPALKLINAWMAGAPALLSPEPSYRRLRRSSLDFVEITRPEHALDAIRHLQANPQVYQAMIDNGFDRAREYLPHEHVWEWVKLFSGPVEAGYRRWAATPALVRRTWWPVRHLVRAVVHERWKREYLVGKDEGPRILTDGPPITQVELPQLPSGDAAIRPQAVPAAAGAAAASAWPRFGAGDPDIGEVRRTA
jgi:hypothetical protein